MGKIVNQKNGCIDKYIFIYYMCARARVCVCVFADMSCEYFNVNECV